MGSSSDWGVMQQATYQRQYFGEAYDARVIFAHHSPDLLFNDNKDLLT